MNYLYLAITMIIVGFIGYFKTLTIDLENKNKENKELKIDIEATKLEVNLTSISSKAIGKIKQIEKGVKNEKKPLDTVGTHYYTF